LAPDETVWPLAADSGAMAMKFYHVSNTALLVLAPLAFLTSPSMFVFPVSQLCFAS
jgi:hypothetical protein